MKTPRLADVDLSLAFPDKDSYEEALDEVQLRLLRLQIKHFANKKRAIIVYEGRDAAGKGGAIKRLTAKLDPRGVKVWPIGPPAADEQGRHYLYRFWGKVPAPGTWSIFDRSWYGRVLVERVDKFARKPEWQRAYSEINAFEKMLSDDGVVIVKMFFQISKKEQLFRFEERQDDPYKKWKISKDDWHNRKKWAGYDEAIDDMLRETHTRDNPWHLVSGEHKWHARVEACRIVADALEKKR
ncbi:MAG TPA: polyphosphate kinase [Polyangiaceae bacterium]|jgi:polyphosphate kinase 2 (PPK2 family)|nr:polyphosphate kinase [Polyangiaceae bacterium]